MRWHRGGKRGNDEYAPHPALSKGQLLLAELVYEDAANHVEGWEFAGLPLSPVLKSSVRDVEAVWGGQRSFMPDNRGG